jgi:hypothetical protein
MTRPQPLRPDETWRQLRWWTYGQAQSERLAGHILAAEGYESIDPSHPLGGPDQGADATCLKDGKQWVMASYFPTEPQSFTDIKKKLIDDIDAARHRKPHGVAFVTGQKVTNSEKGELATLGDDIAVEVYHLERIVHIVDRPDMAQIRQQFVYVSAAASGTLAIKPEVIGAARRFTGGDELMQAWAEFEEKRELKREREARRHAADEERSRAAHQAARLAWMPHRNPLADSAIMQTISQQYGNALWQRTPPEQPKPRSDDEVRAAIQRYRDDLRSRWDDCLDYLASVAWPALHFRIENQAPPMLKRVEVILTFHGAAGLEYIPPSDVEWQKLTDPTWEPPAPGPFGSAVPPLKFHRQGNPIQWRNKGDDLVVTINLPELRAYPPIDLDGDDVVLIVRDSTIRSVTVTWTATAEGHDGFLQGEPFEVPVEDVDARDSTQVAFDAAAS